MNDLRPVNLTVCRCPLCQTRLQSEDDVRKHIMSHHVGEHANPSDMYVKIQESVVQYQNNLRELIDLDIRFAGISALLDCLMADAQPCAVDGSCLFHQRAEDGRCVFDGCFGARRLQAGKCESSAQFESKTQECTRMDRSAPALRTVSVHN